MKNAMRLVALFSVLATGLFGIWGSQSFPVPAREYETFVAAWPDAAGPTGPSIFTMESHDGVTWSNKTTHALVAANRSNAFGAGLAWGDGTWLLVSVPPNRQGFTTRTGTGGKLTDGSGGVVWAVDSSGNPLVGGVVTAGTDGTPTISGKPSVAFGAGTWIVVAQNTDNVVQASVSTNLASWSTSIVDDGRPVSTPVSTNRPPSIEFAGGVFTLAFQQGGNIMTTTSTNGVTWTPRAPATYTASGTTNTIRSPVGPTLTAFEGRLFLVVEASRPRSEPQGTDEFKLFKFSSGSFEPVGRGGNVNRAVSASPALAYGRVSGVCTMLIAQRQSPTENPPVEIELWRTQPAISPNNCNATQMPLNFNPDLTLTGNTVIIDRSVVLQYGKGFL